VGRVYMGLGIVAVDGDDGWCLRTKIGSGIRERALNIE
jgi:hypothetical protein